MRVRLLMLVCGALLATSCAARSQWSHQWRQLPSAWRNSAALEDAPPPTDGTVTFVGMRGMRFGESLTWIYLSGEASELVDGIEGPVLLPARCFVGPDGCTGAISIADGRFSLFITLDQTMTRFSGAVGLLLVSERGDRLLELPQTTAGFDVDIFRVARSPNIRDARCVRAEATHLAGAEASRLENDLRSGRISDAEKDAATALLAEHIGGNLPLCRSRVDRHE
jgi:hypothetical protein